MALNMNKKAVIGIMVLGLFIRFIRLDQPLTEFATRQVQTAMVARNFYYHGFKLFFPELDMVGKEGSSGIVTLEVGLMPFLVALLYKIFGGVHEYLGRIVSIAFWLGGALVFYRWLLFFGERLALAGLLVYTFLPLSIILSRTFQPEMAMLFFSILGLYYLTKYSLGEREIDLWVGAISISMAILLKATAVSLLFPFVFLFLKRERLTPTRSSGIKFWIAGFLILSPPLAWYSRGFLLSQIYISEFSTGNWAFSNWFNFSMWFMPESWRSIFANLWGIALTPLGFSLFLLGLFLKKDRAIEFLFYYWLLGIAFLLLFFFYHAQTHVYYWLPLVPVGAYFMAVALVVLRDGKIGEVVYKNIFIRKLVLPIVIGVMIFYYIYPAYRVPRAYGEVQEVAKTVKSLTSPDSLIIAPCSSGPYFLYYCNRRGWDFSVNDPGIDAIKRLEYLREQGAEYFALANMKGLNKNKLFNKYLYNTYNVIWEKEKTGVIFSLQPKPEPYEDSIN